MKRPRKKRGRNAPSARRNKAPSCSSSRNDSPAPLTSQNTHFNTTFQCDKPMFPRNDRETRAKRLIPCPRNDAPRSPAKQQYKSPAVMTGLLLCPGERDTGSAENVSYASAAGAVMLRAAVEV